MEPRLPILGSYLIRSLRLRSQFAIEAVASSLSAFFFALCSREALLRNTIRR